MLNLFNRNRFVETNRYWKREPVAYRNIYLLTMARHIAGKLKQSNKKHKSNVSSNRAQQRTAGAGKVAGRSAGKPRAEGALNAKQIEQLSVSKSNRVNHKLQLRKKKLEDTWLSRRIGIISYLYFHSLLT